MKGLGPCAPEGFSVPMVWNVCGRWVQSPNTASPPAWSCDTSMCMKGMGMQERVVWPVSLYPQLRSSPCTEGCSHALSHGWPSCGAPLEGSGISPPGRRSREIFPPPCSQPFPSSCPPTGEQKKLSTHSRLKRDHSGLDLAIWGKKENFLNTTDHVFSCQLPTCWKTKLYCIYMKQLKAFSKLAQLNCRTLCSALTASCTAEHFVNI